jgi:hypothetical protein
MHSGVGYVLCSAVTLTRKSENGTLAACQSRQHVTGARFARSSAQNADTACYASRILGRGAEADGDTCAEKGPHPQLPRAAGNWVHASPFIIETINCPNRHWANTINRISSGACMGSIRRSRALTGVEHALRPLNSELRAVYRPNQRLKL